MKNADVNIALLSMKAFARRTNKNKVERLLASLKNNTDKKERRFELAESMLVYSDCKNKMCNLEIIHR